MIKRTMYITMLLVAVLGFTKSAVSKGNKTMNTEPLAKEQKLLGFQENKGQVIDMEGNATPYVLFKAEAPNLNIWITTTGITYQFFTIERKRLTNLDGSPKLQIDGTPEKEKKIRLHRMDMILKGAVIKKENIVTQSEITQGKINYYFSHCPDGIFDVKTYTKVIIKNVYQGIDWIIYTSPTGENIKYDFIVHPNANPNQIKLVYEGSGKMNTTDHQLHFENELGQLTEGNLFCYQSSEPNEVKSAYIVKKNMLPLYLGAGNLQKPEKPSIDTENLLHEMFSYEVSVSIPNYDSSKPLIIDPQLVWGTFYGGNGFDGLMSIDNDSNGNLFGTGYVSSVNFPVQDAGSYYSGTFNGGSTDVFIVKFDNLGTRIWSTYYGGTSGGLGEDFGNSIAIDGLDNVFITGWTNSVGFPLQDAGTYYKGTTNGSREAFILKFDNAGNRLWATYYGGSSHDYAYSITADKNNNIYVVGRTQGTIPLQNSGTFFQATNNGFSNAFILKFDNLGNRLWATLYGGDDDDYPYSVATDQLNSVVITGKTSSTNFPTTVGALQTTNGDGGNLTDDAFILKFDSLGNRLWATYYGGSGIDRGFFTATDKNNNIFVTGVTSSSNFPVQDAGTFFQGMYAGGGVAAGDVFILKFSPSGTRLWATYYGGSGEEGWNNSLNSPSHQSIAIDTSNNVYVSFNTESADITTFNGGCSSYFDGIYGGNSDNFITQFSNTGFLLWASYIGGTSFDHKTNLSVDNNNNLFMGGEFQLYTNSSSLPMVNYGGSAYFNTTPPGDEDSFILKFIPSTAPIVTTTSVSVNICAGSTFTLPGGNIVNTSGTYTDTLTSVNGCDSMVTTTNLTINPAINSTQNPNICFGNTFMLPSGIIVSTSGTYTDTLTSVNGCDSIVTSNLTINSAINSTQNPNICFGNTFMLPSGIIVSTSGTYTDTLTSVNGCDSIVTSNLTINPVINSTQNPNICFGNTFMLPGGNIVSTSGTYTDTLTSVNGCDSMVTTTNLTINPAINSTQNPNICFGNTFMLPSGIIVSTSGTYTDTITSVNGCDSVVTTNLTVNTVPTTTQNPTMCVGSTFTLPSGIIVSTTGTYSDTLTSINGCDSIITTNLVVNSLLTSEIVIPNVFTPNGDGQNDLFKIDDFGSTSITSNIYNRWGELVFASNINNGWDGRTTSGENVSEGTYFYVVVVETKECNIKNRQYIKGTLTLLR